MKSIVITGAPGGLGVCLCAEYLRKGFLVFGWGVERTPAFDALEKEYPDRLRYREVDVTSPGSVQAGADAVAAETEGLDCLINAVGILQPGSAKVLEEFDIESSKLTFDVNSLGPLRVVQALLPLLRRGQDKIIVQISSEAGSIAGHYNYVFRYDYCMSKAALNIQGVILQRYLKPEGFEVLLIYPGWMRTAMGGAEAPTDPADSAAGIVRLADACREAEDRPLFTDFNGKPWPW